MKIVKLTLTAVLLATSIFANAQDQSYADCLVKAKSEWGVTCEKCEYYTDGYKRDYSGVFQIGMKNTCSEIIEVKIAMEEEGGNWRTFPIKHLAPSEEMQAYACHGTGRYLYWVKKVNDSEIVLPSDSEIVSMYRTN